MMSVGVFGPILIGLGCRGNIRRVHGLAAEYDCQSTESAPRIVVLAIDRLLRGHRLLKRHCESLVRCVNVGLLHFAVLSESTSLRNRQNQEPLSQYRNIFFAVSCRPQTPYSNGEADKSANPEAKMARIIERRGTVEVSLHKPIWIWIPIGRIETVDIVPRTTSPLVPSFSVSQSLLRGLEYCPRFEPILPRASFRPRS